MDTGLNYLINTESKFDLEKELSELMEKLLIRHTELLPLVYEYKAIDDLIGKLNIQIEHLKAGKNKNEKP